MKLVFRIVCLHSFVRSLRLHEILFQIKQLVAHVVYKMKIYLCVCGV